MQGYQQFAIIPPAKTLLVIIVFSRYGASLGPLAMILCELGQIRKEATAADDLCAEMWLGEGPPNLKFIVNPSKYSINHQNTVFYHAIFQIYIVVLNCLF